MDVDDILAAAELGRRQGYEDGTHPSGVVTHASHRDPEGWADMGGAWRAGYEKGWQQARDGEAL